MSALDDFIAGLTNSNSGNTLVAVNNSERDGNTDDVLLRFDQSALSIGGGTTLTNLSPYTAVNDLSDGKITLPVLIWLAIAAVVGWFLFKKG